MSTTDLPAYLPANLHRAWVANGSPDPPPVHPEDAANFVVMTYNILNEDLCHDGMFPFCPEEFFPTAKRHALLMKEIDHHSDVDVICMQEVGSQYFYDTLQPAMRTRGFTGVFIKRPEDRLPGDDRPWTDGSATFYRVARFQLEKLEGGYFTQLFGKERDMVQFKSEAKSLVDGMTDSRKAYLFTLFRCLKTNRLVALGNVHLTFKRFKQMDLTTLEAAFAINGLVQFCGGVATPHILCGDFNQEPHHPGYQLLHDGNLNQTMKTYLHNFKEHVGDSEDGESVALVDIFRDHLVHHSTNLRSAYETVVGHEVPFSNYEDVSAYYKTPKRDRLSEAVQALHDGTPCHPKVRKTDPEAYGSGKGVMALDYIWFSSDSLHCEGVLKMVEEEFILPFHACPNAAFPSDHLPVKAQFSFLEA